jgi:hypothetical protein
VLFVGVDWAEDHHDVCVMTEDGRVLSKRRVPHNVSGLGALHERLVLGAQVLVQQGDELIVGHRASSGSGSGSIPAETP